MRAAFMVQAPGNAALRALNYSPYVEAFRTTKRSQRSFSIHDVLASDGIAYGHSFPRRDCDPEHGIELLSQSDMFGSEPAGRWVRPDPNRRAEKHQTKKWDILTAGVGTLGETELYGRSIIVDSRLEGRYVGDPLLLRCAKPGGNDNLYLYAFFCTRIGVSILRSTSCGTKQLRFRISLLSDLRIPDPESAVKKTIADLVRTTVEQREIYVRELRAARMLVETLPEMRHALEQCGTRKPRCILWRSELPTLSAWNLASTGGALAHLQKKWKPRLGDVLTGRGVFNGPRFARISCSPPHGIDFYSQRDLFLIRRVPRRIVHPGFMDNLLFVPEGSLLVGGHGTLGEGEIFGRVVYVSGRLSRAGFTQDLLRVMPRPEMSAVAYTFLSTTVGFRLLRSTGVGTKLLTMRPDLLRALPFPDIDSDLQIRIGKHLNVAMTARNAADEAEDEAVRIIEQEVLPSWLD